MKPEVVCELIRKGENPLEKTLDELQNDVNEILAQNDIEDISFRKYLWKMDHTDGLTEDERETMIGVYRLLHQIEKSDGAAAAQVLNEGKELSLSSLLSAVRTRKKPEWMSRWMIRLAWKRSNRFEKFHFRADLCGIWTKYCGRFNGKIVTTGIKRGNGWK